MEFNEFIQRYLQSLRQYMIPLILGVLGLIFLGGGLIGYFGGKKDKPDILFEAASDSAGETANVAGVATGSKAEKKLIVVDVAGAVERPGVYRLSAESRMQDGLIAAGGLGKGADREAVAKSINLAAKLSDGMKVYIPFQGETETSYVSSYNGQRMININSATLQDLDSLPGIGKTTADKIVNNRPYASVEMLVEKKILGQKVFEQIKERIVAQ